jgi:hypothetical protein
VTGLATDESPDPGSAEGLTPLPVGADRLVALSVKQPWAALLIAGLKTVEVRTWSTRRRGPILIHASKVPDERPEGWSLLTTPELRSLADLRGGIVGIGNLVDCVRYNTAESFASATDLHRNSPDWFRPSGLFGFVFRNLRPIPYHAHQGQTMFFTVRNPTLPG